MANKRVLLIVSGGIAAYKMLEATRLLRKADVAVRAVLTRGGAQFVTPLSLQALTEDTVYQDLFSLTDESAMGHIQLSRDADLVLVAPASADILAKMAAGMADDLATTALLATDKPVMAAPAMNVRMWSHPATQANIATLMARGVTMIGPEEGAMACNEYGMGRMTEPDDIVAAVLSTLGRAPRPLAGKRALVTSGPTHEPIDPVRYIANRSSGKQGHAIAAALARAGADTTLVSGPTSLADPADVTVVRIESATEMLVACEAALPVDICVCAAAVADWRVASRANTKIKKQADAAPPTLTMAENPDILRTLSNHKAHRPSLVIGFAAETNDVLNKAITKRQSKGCDWIVANDVSEGSTTFGGDLNTVYLISENGEPESWPEMSKQAVADQLVGRIADHLETSACMI